MLASLAAAQSKPADLVLRNGKIVTLDSARPQATALAATGDTITAVGSDAEIQPLIGPSTKVIDLKGTLAIPAFIEGHGHFTGLGRFKMNLTLRDAKNWDDVVAMVAARVKKAKPGEWILGRGFHQSKWTPAPSPNVQGFPLHAALSKVSPDNPVLLTHASGHGAFGNEMAMKLAGVTRDTANPSGGEIVRDAQGNATGMFLETAQRLLSRAHDESESKRPAAERIAEERKVIELAAEESLSKGIASFQDAGSSLSTIDLFRSMANEGRLGVRLWVMMRDRMELLEQNAARVRVVDAAGKHLTVRAIKRQLDGALGSRGAWLLEPYSDLPSSSGFNTEVIEDVERMARLALAQNLQLCVHAIGDRANRETLDLYERAFKGHPEGKTLRWRIEHAQHISATDIPRFAQLGVIAAMQAVHCTSDAVFVPARLGAKRSEEGAYVWQKLMKSGAVVTNGTDAPVEEVDPLPSFYAAVTRKLKDGTVFYPDQRMSRQEALESYTIKNAYAAFEEKSKGSLVPGKLADITVLSRDIMTVPENQILGAQVLYTIVGGKVAFQQSK